MIVLSAWVGALVLFSVGVAPLGLAPLAGLMLLAIHCYVSLMREGALL